MNKKHFIKRQTRYHDFNGAPVIVYFDKSSQRLTGQLKNLSATGALVLMDWQGPVESIQGLAKIQLLMNEKKTYASFARLRRIEWQGSKTQFAIQFLPPSPLFTLWLKKRLKETQSPYLTISIAHLSTPSLSPKLIFFISLAICASLLALIFFIG